MNPTEVRNEFEAFFTAPSANHPMGVVARPSGNGQGLDFVDAEGLWTWVVNQIYESKREVMHAMVETISQGLNTPYIDEEKQIVIVFNAFKKILA